MSLWEINDRTWIQPSQKHQVRQLHKGDEAAPVSGEVSVNANPDLSSFRDSSEIL